MGYLPAGIVAISRGHLTREGKVLEAYERAVRGLGGEDYLFQAVRHLVRDLKENGELPEHVVITIKTLCGMPMVPFASRHDRYLELGRTRSISETVVEVAIKEYFSVPARKRVGSR
jgi:hypothetical protein